MAVKVLSPIVKVEVRFDEGEAHSLACKSLIRRRLAVFELFEHKEGLDLPQPASPAEESWRLLFDWLGSERRVFEPTAKLLKRQRLFSAVWVMMAQTLRTFDMTMPSRMSLQNARCVSVVARNKVCVHIEHTSLCRGAFIKTRTPVHAATRRDTAISAGSGNASEALARLDWSSLTLPIPRPSCSTGAPMAN